MLFGKKENYKDKKSIIIYYEEIESKEKKKDNHIHFDRYSGAACNFCSLYDPQVYFAGGGYFGRYSIY